jgi:hypothetical protein
MRIFDRPELENERRTFTFEESPIRVNDRAYPCSDDFLQNAKPTPFDVETWEQERDEVMEKALRAKFSSNIRLREFLVSTFPHQLLSLKKDIHWAFDPDTGCGENVLAQMLMQLRSEFVEEDATAAATAQVEAEAFQASDGKDPKQHLSTANFRLSAARGVVPFAAPMAKAAEAARTYNVTVAAKHDRQLAKEAKSLEDTLKRADWRCFMLTASNAIDLAIQVTRSKQLDEQKVFTKRHQWCRNKSEVLMGLIKAKFPQMLLLDFARQNEFIQMLAKECYDTLELSQQTKHYGMSIKRLLRALAAMSPEDQAAAQQGTSTGKPEERKLAALSVVAVNLLGSKEVSSCYFSTVIFTHVKSLLLRIVPELLEQWKVIIGDDSYLRRKCLGDSC